MQFDQLLVNETTKNKSLYLNGVFFIESELSLENFLKKDLSLKEINIDNNFLKKEDFFFVISKKIENKMFNIKIVINFSENGFNNIKYFDEIISKSTYIQKKFFHEIKSIDFDLFKENINIIKINNTIEKESKRIVENEFSAWKKNMKLKYNDKKILEIINNISL